METVFDIVRKQEQDYISQNTKISEYVDFSLKDNVNRIDAYLNSKHISGEKDSRGREKPFFNIVTAAVNVWYRATDIDRANIRIRATKSADHTTATLADIKSKQWMRDANFGVFLNDWGRSLARYGSSVVKFVEQNGELKATVVPWNRLIVDSVNFEDNVKIEKLYYTPAQLRKNKAYDADTVEDLIAAQTSRKTLSGEKKDNKADYIEVYELHGELPTYMLEDLDKYDPDADIVYTQQVHVVSFIKGEGDDYTDYSLFSGKEKDPYMITHLIEEDGRTMSIGAVEQLFESQWMINHNEKAIKDQLDLASKMVFQTSDPAYQGKNTGSLDTGSILYHEANQPLTQLANNSHDITPLMNSKNAWQTNANEQVSTPDAVKGNTMPSGTAARQVEALQQESHSLFELMTENKGLAIEAMWRTFVIPFIKKGLDTTDEIVETLDAHNIKKIDQMYIPNQVKKRDNERIKKEMTKMLEAPLDANAPFPQPSNPQEATATVQNELAPLGNTRFFKPSEIDSKTWKQVFKNFEWDAEVEVTNEAHDKQSTLTSLTTIYLNLANSGDIDNARMVLNKLLEETGVFSPMELMSAPAPQQAPAVSPTPQDVPAPQP